MVVVVTPFTVVVMGYSLWEVSLVVVIVLFTMVVMVYLTFRA